MDDEIKKLKSERDEARKLAARFVHRETSCNKELALCAEYPWLKKELKAIKAWEYPHLYTEE